MILKVSCYRNLDQIGIIALQMRVIFTQQKATKASRTAFFIQSGNTMSGETSSSPKSIVYSYSLPPSLSQPLKDAIAEIGLRYLTELLTAIATYPSEAAEALRPLAQKYMAERKPPPKSETERKVDLMGQLTGFSSSELEALLKVAAAKKN
jgi:hypothetical protein